MLRITSKRNGFRRCGVEHPDRPVLYPSGRFTDEEVRKLKAEPMLVVEELPDPDEDEPKAEATKGGRKKAKGEDSSDSIERA